MCRTVLPTILAFIAFILSLSTVLKCNFVQFTSTSGIDTPITLKFGPFRHETLSYYTDLNGNNKHGYIVESCTGYSDNTDIDSNWRASKAFAILPLIIGGIALVGMSIAACDRDDRRIPSSLNGLNSIAYLLASLFQGLSLLFLSSNACNNNILIDELSNSPVGGNGVSFEETCTAAAGAKCIVWATVLWFLAGVGSVGAYRYTRDDERVVHMQPAVMGEPLLF